MANRTLRVYLDHHIKRGDLLYKRNQEQPVQMSQYQRKVLDINQLADETKRQLLRKPDFQRSTTAWTPEECVDIIDSVLNNKVVPSVIMWLGPDRFQYVLDGGHRISVLIAWITDDWGDKSPIVFNDDQLEGQYREAARKVKDLLNRRGIGSYQEHQNAANRYREGIGQDQSFLSRPDLSNADQEMAERVRSWESIECGYSIQWVTGDYDAAEESFIKINKSGKRLTEWETKLVENRKSGFARTVVSVANPHDASHCWPDKDQESVNNESLKKKREELLKDITDLSKTLFHPGFELPIKSLFQPLMAPPAGQPEAKPGYLAEFFTITEGKKGLRTETKALLEETAKTSASLIVNNGLTLIQNAQDAVGNIHGSSPRSLSLIPLVYFYSPQGRYIRGLLYGILYWLNHGDSEDVHNRKLIFSSKRGEFEDLFIKQKDTFIERIYRRIGSGPEVTQPTSQYFNELLKFLLSEDFPEDSKKVDERHFLIIENLGKSSKNESEVSKNPANLGRRALNEKDRDKLAVNSYLDRADRCQICGGRMIPNHNTQVDHIVQFSHGGPTSIENSRFTHPFCNNNREKIENLKTGKLEIPLPKFEEKELKPQQLPLFSFMKWEDEVDDEEYKDEADQESAVN